MFVEVLGVFAPDKVSSFVSDRVVYGEVRLIKGSLLPAWAQAEL